MVDGDQAAVDAQPRRDERGRRGQRQRVRPAGAGDEAAAPMHVALSGKRPTDRDPDRGDGRRDGPATDQPAAGDGATRADPGRRVGELGQARQGERRLPDLVEAGHADPLDDAVDERRPSAYWRSLTSMPISLRMTFSSGLASSRRRLNFARISATDGTTSGPTPSMTNSAWPSSSVISAVSRSSTARCAGVCTRSSTDARLSGLRVASARVATPRRTRSNIWSWSSCDASTKACTSPRKWPRSHGTAVNWVRWVTSCRQTQSRKSRGSALEPALGLDDVRRDEQQLARVGGEDLVLAEHPAGQVGEHGAGLDAGEPGADGGADRARVLAAGEPLGERGDDLAQAGDVGRGPVLAVDHPDRRRRPPALSCVYSRDVGGRLVGEAAQVGDGVSRLVQAHPRAGLAQGARGGCGEIPIDKLRHAPHRTRGTRLPR